jgi:hypothetical protein
MTAVYGAVIGLTVVVVLMALLVIGLLRSHAEILRKLDSLGAGADVDHEHDHPLTLHPTRATNQAIPSIAGASPHGACSSCTPFWENLNRSEDVFGNHRHRVLIATLGEDEESPTRVKSLVRGTADVVMSSKAWEDYGVPGAPYFVVVDPSSGVIGEGSAVSYEALQQFLIDSSSDRDWDEHRANRYRADAARETRVDEELRQAGIRPGDPRLFPGQGQIEDGK